MTEAISEIVSDLREMGSTNHVEGMSRFGIETDTALGIRIPRLRAYAKKLGKQHELAIGLWETDLHEARLLAIFLAEPKKFTEAQMEHWVNDLRSWDICDQACSVFDRTPFAYDKAMEWAFREPEFEKRAGFAMMACMAVHLKKLPDETFLHFLPIIESEAHDDRNFVKKAVNWALRQIGKRSPLLLQEAMATAERIAQQDSASAKWIAADALRELKGQALKKAKPAGKRGG